MVKYTSAYDYIHKLDLFSSILKPLSRWLWVVLMQRYAKGILTSMVEFPLLISERS